MTQDAAAGGAGAGRRVAAGGVLTAARHLALDAAAVDVLRLLEGRGVRCLLLKGPAVAHRLYPQDPQKRRYCDVDLLVPPAQFAAAQRALAAAGYRPSIEGVRSDDWCWHEREWVRPGPLPVAIDLHRSVAGVTRHEALWAALWCTRDELRLGAAVVPIPSADAAALLLALHAASPGGSPKPRRELVRALEVLAPERWEAAAALAFATGAESAFALGLRLAPGGGELARRLGLPQEATPLEWLDAHPASAAASALARVAAVRAPTGKAVHVVRRLLPSAGFMRYSDPRARRGRAGLAVAYLSRLGRLAVQVPRGVVEVRTASRLARGRSGRHRVADVTARGWRPRGGT